MSPYHLYVRPGQYLALWIQHVELAKKWTPKNQSLLGRELTNCLFSLSKSVHKKRNWSKKNKKWGQSLFDFILISSDHSIFRLFSNWHRQIKWTGVKMVGKLLCINICCKTRAWTSAFLGVLVSLYKWKYCVPPPAGMELFPLMQMQNMLDGHWPWSLQCWVRNSHEEKGTICVQCTKHTKL